MDLYQKYIEKFKKLGFSPNEARVYLTLSKTGSAKAGTIAKVAGMDRSSTYNSLTLLLKKGMASYVTIGKTKWFQCSSADNILRYLSNKLEIAHEVVPELKLLQRESKLKENVQLFKGRKGVQAIFEDILEHATENLVFGSEGQFAEKMPLFAKQFTKKMENKGIHVKSIIRSTREDRDKRRNVNLRTIPSENESPVVTNIYDDKIAIIIWSEEPEGILIENKKAAEAYQDYFKFMWKFSER